MDSTMEKWYRAASERFSVRQYGGGPSDEQFASLLNTARTLSARGVRLEPKRGQEAFRGLLGGRIRGTDAYAALISNGARPEEAGYIGEAFVLECAALGLGSCWLGASYSKGGVNSAVRLNEGEKLICVISFGVAAEEYAARPRRSVAELTELSRDEYDALPEWKRTALLCARIAPSALNTQPWSFDPTGEGITVENISGNFGWGRIDCGIAMLHIELGASHCGVYGNWDEGQVFNTYMPLEQGPRS